MMPQPAMLCASHGCDESMVGPPGTGPESTYCVLCRSEFSVKALDLMRELEMGLPQLLIRGTELFSTAQSIADYLGVSLPTLYAWIQREFQLNFRQFKRKFVCSKRHKACIVLDHSAAGYGWKYTMGDRVQARGGCICYVEGAQMLMTTLSREVLGEALRAEVCAEEETGVSHLRYPIRLPIFQEKDDLPFAPCCARGARIPAVPCRARGA